MENKPEKEPTIEPLIEKEKPVESAVESVEVRTEDLEKNRVLSEREKMIREKLEREVEMMRKDSTLNKEAGKRAEEIKSIDEEGKLKRLLDLAGEKGVVFAIGVAKDMQDPYT
ncbi:MAG: hypothetical protein ABID67_00275, partial [Candidatus Nealsonbacteria bacterium]